MLVWPIVTDISSPSMLFFPRQDAKPGLWNMPTTTPSRNASEGCVQFRQTFTFTISKKTFISSSTLMISYTCYTSKIAASAEYKSLQQCWMPKLGLPLNFSDYKETIFRGGWGGLSGYASAKTRDWKSQNLRRGEAAATMKLFLQNLKPPLLKKISQIIFKKSTQLVCKRLLITKKLIF